MIPASKAIQPRKSGHIYVEEEILTRNLSGRNGKGGEIPLLSFIAGIQWQLYTQWQRYPFVRGRTMDKVRNMSPGWATSFRF